MQRRAAAVVVVVATKHLNFFVEHINHSKFKFTL
jgi:hypothetical protein